MSALSWLWAKRSCAAPVLALGPWLCARLRRSVPVAVPLPSGCCNATCVAVRSKPKAASGASCSCARPVETMACVLPKERRSDAAGAARRRSCAGPAKLASATPRPLCARNRNRIACRFNRLGSTFCTDVGQEQARCFKRSSKVHGQHPPLWRGIIADLHETFKLYPVTML